MAEYVLVFIKLYEVGTYLNSHVKDGWDPQKISDPIRTSKATACLTQTNSEEAGFSVHIVLARTTTASHLHVDQSSS